MQYSVTIWHELHVKCCSSQCFGRCFLRGCQWGPVKCPEHCGERNDCGALSPFQNPPPRPKQADSAADRVEAVWQRKERKTIWIIVYFFPFHHTHSIFSICLSSLLPLFSAWVLSLHFFQFLFVFLHLSVWVLVSSIYCSNMVLCSYLLLRGWGIKFNRIKNHFALQWLLSTFLYPYLFVCSPVKATLMQSFQQLVKFQVSSCLRQETGPHWPAAVWF